MRHPRWAIVIRSSNSALFRFSLHHAHSLSASQSFAGVLAAPSAAAHLHTSGCAGFPVLTQTQLSAARRPADTTNMVLIMMSSSPRTRRANAPSRPRNAAWQMISVKEGCVDCRPVAQPSLLTRSCHRAHCEELSGAFSQPSGASRSAGKSSSPQPGPRYSARRPVASWRFECCFVSHKVVSRLVVHDYRRQFLIPYPPWVSMSSPNSNIPSTIIYLVLFYLLNNIY
jgi:hypothetical protein